MTRPKILTSEFWARRIDALTDLSPRAFRTGAQAALLTLGQDVLGVDAFAVDWRNLVGSFVGGVVVWVLTTAALPPKS